jgi:hypothetical protein
MCIDGGGCMMFKVLARAATIFGLVFAATQASSTTLSFNGNSYADTLPPTDYFLLNPTPVGGTTTYRFYLDTCHAIDEIGPSFGDGPLQSCSVQNVSVSPGSFFNFTYDGLTGESVRRSIFYFTLSFIPTNFSTDALQLTGGIDFSVLWAFQQDGNSDDYSLAYEGAIVGPAPVPAPPSLALLAIGLGGLGVVRRRSTPSRPAQA